MSSLSVDGFEIEHQNLITRIAEVISILPSLSNTNKDGSRVDAVIESLLSVISGLSKMTRDTNLQFQRFASREQDAVRLLSKFKKIAKQQKDIIELREAAHQEALLAQQLQPPSPPPPPPPPPKPTTHDASISTTLSGTELDRIERENAARPMDAEKLEEKEDACHHLTEQVRVLTAENKKLRLVVQRSQEVIDAQQVLMDRMEAKRKDRISAAVSGGPALSRESTPVHSRGPRDRWSWEDTSTATRSELPFPSLHSSRPQSRENNLKYADDRGDEYTRGESSSRRVMSGEEDSDGDTCLSDGAGEEDPIDCDLDAWTESNHVQRSAGLSHDETLSSTDSQRHDDCQYSAAEDSGSHGGDGYVDEGEGDQLGLECEDAEATVGTRANDSPFVTSLAESLVVDDSFELIQRYYSK